MGRVKLKLKRLENINGRQATYAKRKYGIMKNANELSILCDIDMVFLMFSPTGRPALVEGQHRNFGEVIEKFAQLSYCERMKRKLESLEALKKTFKKLDHDVNIDYFMGGSSDFPGLSYWSDLNNINDIGRLNQMENMLRESIKGILLQKENLAKRPPVSTNYRKQAQLPPWVANSENQHVDMVQPSVKKPLLHGGIEFLEDALSPNCSGYFGTGYYKKMEVDDTGKLSDVGHVDSALNDSSTNSGLSVEHDKKYGHSSIITQFPNSMKLEPHERNLSVSPVAYQVNRNFGPPGSQYDEECQASTSASQPGGSAIYNENAHQQVY